MGKFVSGLMAIAVLGIWCSLVYPSDIRPQHRGVGVQQTDSSWGDVIYFVLYVLCMELGKHLDRHPMGDYTCPDYCEVKHKHIRSMDEEPPQEETQPDKERDPAVHGPVILADGER
tara:strand:+ start:413 stop:760 length:348 start_codon:yes stop_codon:yes gene_type:complete